jgi:hypothetical protein
MHRILFEIVAEFCITHVCLIASKLGKKVSTNLGAIYNGLTGVFSDKVRRAEDNESEVKELHAKIGKLAV